MSVATARFAALLEGRMPVLRLATSGHRHGRSVGHHITRAARTLVAAARIAMARRGDRLYAGCDAGPGMAYVVVVMAVGRAKRLPRVLHHHSYAYVTRRSTLMALLVWVAGPTTVHVFTCDRQGNAFARRYRSARVRRTVPITFTLDEPVAPADRPRLGPDRTVVLGHFGNLTLAKGVGTALATLDACLAQGLDAVLHLGGPVVEADAEVTIAQAQARLGPRLVCQGPVHGRAKDDYLTGLDAFLFPSRYHNESFGIVVAEAMAAGVPVIAHEAGCLDARWVGNGGLVVDLNIDFVAAAVRQLRAWVDDPGSHELARRAAHERACEGWEVGRHRAEELADLLTAAPPPSADPDGRDDRGP